MPEKPSAWHDVPMPWSALGRTMTACVYSMIGWRDTLIGVQQYSREFIRNCMNASAIFNSVERTRMPFRSPCDNFRAYSRLFETNLDLARRVTFANLKVTERHALTEMERARKALLTTWLGADGEGIDEVAIEQAGAARGLIKDYPEAIQSVAEEFGFHFERGLNPLVAETEHFLLYRIMPNDAKVRVVESAKPLIIIPPYVLGSDILAFLPGEGRSYAHAFANAGIPTYIRIMKDIATHEAVQLITGEDDAIDTRLFCEKVMATHGRPVTLNGYCQGGFSSVVNLLSGELDGLVDTLITCVAPMDGTRSPGLSGFLGVLPDEFNNLAYGIKTLPNGNRVADGHLMGWVYKLKSIETENPLGVYFRDLAMIRQAGGAAGINKSAAAITYWLSEERNDLPLAITRMSHASYRTPFSDDGTLPFTLFGRELNLNRLERMGVKWLICYGEKDDLVEKDCALAPTRTVKAEVTEFPRGHIAIATSWSDPTSKYGLHKVYPDGSRGPVRFQLDVDAESRARSAPRAPAQCAASQVGAEVPSSEKPATRRTTARKPPADA